MFDPTHDLQRRVALAPRTSLELGGDARDFLCAREDDAIVEAIAWAQGGGERIWILGGGSNVVISDDGLEGLVIEIATRGVRLRQSGDAVHVHAMAGESWDALVARVTAAGLCGIECLSGIPGRVGATPIQNVGAYGQEISDVLRSVRVLDRARGCVEMWSKERCELTYRDSLFKREPDRWVVLEVELQLRTGAPDPPRYAELTRALAGEPAPSVARIREVVLQLRRRKSMVLDASDPCSRSAGSFFTNPVVDPATADRVAAEAMRLGVIESADAMPRFAAPGGVKLAAGWLVEAAGLRRGHGEGAIGLSDHHALAIVHRGGGTAAELVAFARDVQRRVETTFGVRLQPEPVFLGLPPL